MSDKLEPLEPEEGLELYLDKRKPNVAESTYRAHRIRLGHFVRWCDEEGIDNLNEISGRDLHRYRIWRRDEGKLNRVSVRTQMSTLRCFVSFCADVNAMSDGIRDAVDVPELERGENSRDVMLDEERVGEILERLRKYDYASLRHVLIRLLWVTGCRLGGVRALDVEDITTTGETSSIEFRHRPETGTPLKNKQSGERVVSIDGTTSQILEDWIQDKRPDETDGYGRDPLLSTRHGRIGKTTIRRHVYVATSPGFIGRSCTCDVDEHEPSNLRKCDDSVSPHALRRSSLTAMLRRGNSDSLVGDRADVSTDILSKHYDEMTDSEKMIHRREEMDWI
jgi:site-specific recombinase XerD